MKIKLETLSPIHIGSGVQYQGNAEYLYFDREKVLVVADEEKILDIIGTENIHIWVGYIENRENRQSFLEYLRQRKPNIRPEDVAQRIIPLKGNQSPHFTNTLREQIHSGMGVPFIPGSSIKGAIRTSIFSQTIIPKYETRGLGDRDLNFRLIRRGNYEVPDFNDQNLQREVFGQNPNSDWMRMLQVGDCYFPNSTHAAFSETLNEKGANQQYEIKGEVRQLIEYIPAGRTAEFQINIPEAHRDLIMRKEPRLFASTARQLNYHWLCSVLQQHALRLLRNEIVFFKDADLPDDANGLQDFMKEMEADAKDFLQNVCLLRLGFGTGYRNMTGDWVKYLVQDNDLYDDVATATRRTSRYNKMPLPKSRKIMFDGVLPGYLKLTFDI